MTMHQYPHVDFHGLQCICPAHGPFQPLPAITTSSVYSVCAGKHCAHDVRCNRMTTWNGA